MSAPPTKSHGANHLGWLLLLLVASCVRPGPEGDPPGKTDHPGFTTEGCPHYADPITTGQVENKGAVEISGAVMSRMNPGVLWLHNDGRGDSLELYAVTRDGQTVAELRIPDLAIEDLEDISFGPGPRPDRDYLYLGDIGDNGSERSEIRIIRVLEPKLDDDEEVQAEDVEVFRLRYHDYKSHDAEALVVDPVSAEILIITKDGGHEKSTQLFHARALGLPGINFLKPVFSDHDNEALEGSVVAADVSHDGRRAVVLLKDGGVRSWSRQRDDELLVDMLKRPACRGPSAPGQQEAIALSADGDSYYLVPEGPEPAVSFVATREPCQGFQRNDYGQVSASSIQEISGLAVSWWDSKLLWAVNDSGEGRRRNYLSAIHADGWHIADIDLPALENIDWEDLAVGPGPTPGLSYLYIADIGDNDLKRNNVQVHRLPEPQIGSPPGPIDTLTLAYPGHRAHDAESLFVDPITGDLYVVTRQRPDDAKTRVYRAKAPFDLEAEIRLEKVLDQGDNRDLANTIVAADMSRDGRRLALARREGAPLVFERSIEGPAFEALKYRGCRAVDAPGKQDSLALSGDGTRFYLLAEGAAPSLYAIDAENLDD